MPNVLLNVPDGMLAKIDARVKQARKVRRSERVDLSATSEELEHAKKLAKKKGASAANHYLSKLRKDKRPPRVSRVRMILGFIEDGLKK